MRRVLVTGASGFLGGAVAGRLLELNWDVLGTGRKPNLLAGSGRYIPADLSDRSAVRDLVAGCDAVVHVAGLAHRHSNDSSREEHFRNNADVTELLARAAAAGNVRQFVLVSTVATYGTGRDSEVREDAPCYPKTIYGLSKLEAEARAKAIASSSGMQLTILRMATIYGEGDPGNCGRLMRAIDEGKFIWVGNGGNKKSLIYRADAAEACGKALARRGGEVEIYNISGPPVTMKEVVEAFRKALGKHAPRFRIPSILATSVARIAAWVCLNRGPAVEFLARLDAWLRDDVFNVEKAYRDLGFQACTSLNEGIHRQVEAYRQGNRLSSSLSSEKS